MSFETPQSTNEAILQNMLGASNEIKPPQSRVEKLLQELSGQMPEANPSEGTTTGTLERLKIGDDIYSVEGGGSGTSDYDALNNKPQIAGVTLSGDKSLADLGVASATTVSGILDGTDIDSFGDVETALDDKVDKVNGKGLSTNDYDDTEKAAVAAATTAISGIKDGTTIDSFGDVETALGAIQDGQSIDSFADVESALSNKQDTLTFDDVPTANSDNPVKSGGVKSAIDAAVASAYHHAGTKTCAELVAGLLVAANEGNVYNMTDSGTTTSDFIEGQGQPIKAGDNVGVCKVSAGVYKFDLLSGFVDTSNFVQKSVTAGLIKNDGTIDTVAKQPATDNNLTTTDKTTTGAINELKSGLNDFIKITNTPLDNSTLAPGGFKANACAISIPTGYTLAGFYITPTGAYTSYCTFYTSVAGVIQATNTHQTETAELTGMVVALFVKTSFLS